jgi:polyvinyl alcohol dehydrogenase (cytochrome)
MISRSRRVAPAAFCIAFMFSLNAADPDGATLYKRDCAICHDASATSRAPSPEALHERSPEAIVEALNGVMRIPGSRLNALERRALAEYLTGKKMGGDVSGAMTGRCPAQPAFRDPSSGPAWNGWSPDLTNTVFQSTKQAGLTADDVPRLKLKWAFGFPDSNSAWGGITVVSGRLFTGGQNGTVYSLDAKTGCIYWTFSAVGGVRTPITIAPREGGRYTAYFGDNSAFAYAVDAFTGEKLWSRKLEEHPVARITGQPRFYEGKLYVPMASYEETMGTSTNYECCTFRGSLTALDPKTGAVIWKTYTIPEEPKPRVKNKAGGQFWGPGGAAVWSSPTIDAKRGAIYVSTGNCYSGPFQPTCDAVLALDIKTGKVLWSMQPVSEPQDVSIAGCGPRGQSPYCPDGEAEDGPDFDFGNPPILTKLPNGKDAIVIGQKSGLGFAMDPDDKGKVLWQYRAGEGSANGGMEWGSAVDSEHVYFPVADNYRPKPGGLHAVNLATGERAWFTPAPPPKCTGGRTCNGAQAAAITVIPGVVFSGSNDGAMRAFSTKDGSLIWEYDTNHDFQTVNGVPGKGASIVGAPPTVLDGMVYINSGYGTHGGRPGNVMLAFAVDEPAPQAPRREVQWVRLGYYKEITPDRWKSRVEQMLRKDAEAPPAKEGVLFAGSATIAGWDLKHYFPEYKTINRGIGGSMISETTYYTDQLIIPFKPSTIVYYSGDNDTAYGMPTDMIADDFREFVAKIHKALPNTQMVVISIRPSIARLAVWDAVVAARDKKLQFVDLTPLLLTADGKPRAELLGADQHHLNKDGFDLVSPVVKKAVEEAETRYWRGRTRTSP